MTENITPLEGLVLSFNPIQKMNQMTANFQSIAKKIVNDSIRNAIYVDDDIVTPFSEGNLRIKEFCKNLYDSFRQMNCTLDFYKYQKNKNWRTRIDLFFRRKDLLILDWKLDGHSFIPDVLKIIEQGVGTDNLHFICIFTDTPKGNFEDILYSIQAHFSNRPKISQPQIVEWLYEHELEFDDLAKKTSTLFKEIGLYPAKRDETLQKLKDELQSFFGNNYSEFKST